MSTLYRANWTGPPVKRSDGWRLEKTIAGRPRHAVCELWVRSSRFELRLVTDGGEFQRSQVCRSKDEMLTVVTEWRAAMMAKGWA